MRWVSACRGLMSTAITAERRPLGSGGRVNRRDRRGSFSSPRRWWREEESEVEALRRKVPVSACVHGGGPPGLFYTCSEAACANDAENLFFLLAQRATLSSVWYFNRKFTCSSDARSVMSAAVDRPGASWSVLDSPGQSWSVLDCRPVRPDHRGSDSILMVEPKISNIPGIMINWEDSLRSGQAFICLLYIFWQILKDICPVDCMPAFFWTVIWMSLIMMTVGTFYYFESFWWKEKIVFLYIENAFMTFFFSLNIF